LSQPKPGYTEEGRKNNVTGTVRLRVTFNANGSIGSITPISTLPYGLTEKAIAAAQSIRFEPKKVNGVAQTAVKVIQYGFTIY
jgi:TonB family protein